jgi:protoporphyrin/coproporphyrin ferrochelatase
MTAPAPLGVLVMAYGGPNHLDEVEPYLMDVRGGRPTPRTVIEEVRERYREIGGRSPILERTQAQADALEAALNQGEPHFRAYVGMRHWHPHIGDTLARMAADGLDRAVGLVMAPHYSRMSIGAYFNKIAEAASPLTVAPIERWHLLPGYLDALAEQVRTALAGFPAELRARVPVIYTAHSLPERIREWDDPYPAELAATVEALAERLPGQPHHFAYQSAAMTPDPWLGPDASEVIERLAAEGHRHVLIAPIGFVCEHVEIMYDVDIVFRRQAEGLGLDLRRIEMLNTAPAMIEGLAGLVRQQAAARGWL